MCSSRLPSAVPTGGGREGGRETKQNDNKQNAVNETTASTL